MSDSPLTVINERLRDTELVYLALAGSHAYGTNHELSDVDYRGVLKYESSKYLTIDAPFRPEPVEMKGDPDVVIHEIGKFLKLALDNNPNILEILYSPTVIYTCESFKPFIANRDKLLSQKCRKTYGGYAHQQVKRFKAVAAGRGDDAGRWKPIHRHKHLLHCFRLVQQCTSLLETGTLDIVVHNKDELVELASKSYDDVDFFEKEFTARLNRMDNCKTQLRPEPDRTVFNELLKQFHIKSLEEEGQLKR